MGSRWFEKPVRILQFNIEDRYSASITGLKGKDIVDLAKRINANVIVLFARDPWGRAYYRSSFRPMNPKLHGRDLVKEVVEEAHKHGIKVIVMVGHTADQYMYRKHTDWAQVNYRGETILLEHVPLNERDYEVEWPQMCINSPFIDYIKKEIEEVARLNVDGIFLDSFRYQPDIERACYCKWCRTRFRKEYGYDMPVRPDWNDSRWRTLWDWRYKVVVERIAELSRLTKSFDRNIVFMYNSHPGGWAGRTSRVVEEARDYIDVVFAECSEADHQPPGFITEMVKLTKAMSGGKPVWASRNYFHMYRTVSSTTPLAIRQGLRESIIAGGCPWILVFSNALKQDPAVLDAVGEVFREYEAIEEFLEGSEPIRYAGIVVSNKTRDYYGRDEPEHYVDEVRGFYYALIHRHLPVEFISEKDLNLGVLHKYRIVVLANTVSMDPAATNVIARYVRDGGSVITTFMTSTMDTSGVELHDFMLSEVLGVELSGLLKTPWSYIIIDHGKGVFSKSIPRIIPWGDMSYSFISSRTAPTLGWHTIVKIIGDEAFSTALIGITCNEWGFEYTLGRSPPALASETPLPAIVLNKYGAGHAMYFTGQVGRHYWRVGLPAYKNLIYESIVFLGGAPPIETLCPETVAAEYYRQGERILIHLLNHTYNQRILAMGIGKTKQPIPGYSSCESVHPPREVVPVHNIKIVVRNVDASISYRAYSPLSKKCYTISLAGNILEINVDLLHEYDLIVIEPRR